MFQEKATVWSHQALSKDVLLLEVSAPQVVAAAKPGQFVHVKPVYGNEVLLRRPISIHKVDKAQGRLWLLYQLLGKGTEAISRLREGDALDVMGPLGNGFELEAKKAPYLIIGGGMGVAPFSFVAHYLKENNIPFKVLLGAKNEKDLYSVKEFENLGQKPLLATDDGSIGFHGSIVEVAEKILLSEPFSCVLACGPFGMLNAVSSLVQGYGLTAQLSLEARMACGVGACLGCTVKKAVGSGYYKVCKDGPVFAPEEVKLDA